MNSAPIPAPVLERPAKTGARLSVSIVIPTKNRIDELCQTLRSLFAQTYPPLEVVIVDQSDSPRPRQAVEQLWAGASQSQLPALQYISDTQLSGSAVARNVGIDHCHGEVILFLDDDVILEPEFIARLLVPYSLAEVGGVGGVITNYSHPPLPDRLFRALFMRGIFRDSRQPFYWNAERLKAAPPAPIDRLGGGLMSFRRQICNAVRFDPSFTGYSLGEDIDFSYNVSRKWRVMIHPGARLVHLRAPGTRPRQDWRFHEFSSYIHLYRRNWAARPVNRLAFGWLSFGFLLQALLSSIRRRSAAPVRLWRQALQK